MLKFKQILFGLFVVVSVAAGIWAYMSLKNSKKPQISALSVLPDSCLVYLNTNNFFNLTKKINTQSLIADKLKLFSDVNLLCNRLQKFDSLFSSVEILKEEINENSLHFAMYGNNAAWLVSFNLKRLGNQGEVAEAIAKLFNAKTEEKNLFSFSADKNLSAYYSLYNGIVLVSNSNTLLKKGLDNRFPKFENSRTYAEFKATLSEDNLLSIFINHQLYSSNNLVSKLNLTAFCKKGYSAGQIELEPSGLKINGFLSPDSNEVVAALANQEGQSPEDLLGILPHNTTAFIAYGFSSFPDVLARLTRTHPGLHKKFWGLANDDAMYNLEKEFNSNIKNHLLSFETGVPGQEYLAAEIKDTALLKEQLKHMADSSYTESGLTIFGLKKITSEPGLFSPLMETNTGFASLFNTYLIFSSSRENLTSLLQNLKNGLLAFNNQSFNYYQGQNFPDSYNYLVYASPSNSRHRVESIFNFDVIKDSNPFETLKHFSFSLTNDAKAFKYRVQILNEAESNAREQNVLWTFNLDTNSVMTPGNFINHLSGENEVVLQDESNNLYLINAKGSLLWKKKLDEKILSAVYSVDGFKNNKFQMLFNTKNHLYLIDRNGNNVKGFPVDLPAPATSALCILDYDKDKDYRLIIACADHAIYNYDIHGKAIEGFVPVKTENDVNLPVQYVKVGASDYLVALDKEGKIYTFSRKGAGRIGLKNRSLANCPAFFVDATNDLATTNLICVDDKSGLINKISFIDKKELIKLNMEHGAAHVGFYLVDDNRDMDIVLTHHSNIQTFNFNGDLLLEKSSELNLETTGYYSDESHALYYSLNAEKTELFVYDSQKQTSKNIKSVALPLVSDLFGDNKKYLLVTNGKQLSCLPID